MTAIMEGLRKPVKLDQVVTSNIYGLNMHVAFTTQLRNKIRLKHLRKKKGLKVTGQQVFPTRHAFEVNALFGGVA